MMDLKKQALEIYARLEAALARRPRRYRSFIGRMTPEQIERAIEAEKNYPGNIYAGEPPKKT